MVRHIGVFCVLIAAALAAPWFMPTRPSEPFLVGAVLLVPVKIRRDVEALVPR